MSFGAIANVQRASGRIGRKGTKREAVFRAWAFAEAAGILLSNDGLLHISAEKWIGMHGDDAEYNNYSAAVASEVSRVMAGKADAPDAFRDWVEAEYQKLRDDYQALSECQDDDERMEWVKANIPVFDYSPNPSDKSKLLMAVPRTATDQEAGAIIASYYAWGRKYGDMSAEDFMSEYVEPWNRK